MNTPLSSAEPHVWEIMQAGARHNTCFQGQISLSQTSSLKKNARRPGGSAEVPDVVNYPSHCSELASGFETRSGHWNFDSCEVQQILSV